MSDPICEIIALLRPQAVFTKGISGAGRWGVRYASFGHPGFAVVTEGTCRLAVDGEDELVLEAGDFVLLPATPAFTLSGFDPVVPELVDPQEAANATGEVRHGRQDGPPEVRLLGGYFLFETPDKSLLLSLLPGQLHVRGVERLSTLVRLLIEEASGQCLGRDLVLARLVEILMVEALRCAQTSKAPAGLLRGLADARIAEAIRRMHAAPARPWTMAQLASAAALSRSAFFERFARHVGVPPMEYLLCWRMALAADLLTRGDGDIADVAARVGYGSASTFSTAFSRHFGLSPGRYARAHTPAPRVGPAQAAQERMRRGAVAGRA